MKYFLIEEERKKTGGTCYFEFQKGKFRNKFWQKNSLCLHADTFDALMLYQLFSGVIEKFCYYSENEVNKEQWKNIIIKSKENEKWKNVLPNIIVLLFAVYSCYFQIVGKMK